MAEVRITELKQNTAQIVARAASGEVIVITNRGKPVAQIAPLPVSRLQQLIDAGLATPATRKSSDLGPPVQIVTEGPALSEVLQQMRDEERY